MRVLGSNQTIRLIHIVFGLCHSYRDLILSSSLLCINRILPNHPLTAKGTGRSTVALELEVEVEVEAIASAGAAGAYLSIKNSSAYPGYPTGSLRRDSPNPPWILDLINGQVHETGQNQYQHILVIPHPFIRNE